MRVVTITLPKDVHEIEIVPLSDAHIGDPLANEKAFVDMVRYISEKPNCYAILNGDLLNNAIKSSVSDTYTEVLSPMEQLVKMVTILRPIQGRILAILQGNHEARTWRESGIDVTRLIARELGVEDRYAEGMAYIILRFGDLGATRHHQKARYTILATHGSGGGKTVGGKANRLADLVSIIDADIYLYGHTHETIIFKESFWRIDLNNDNASLVDRMFVNSGAFLDWGGYAESKQLRPSSITPVHIILSGDKRKMSAHI